MIDDDEERPEWDWLKKKDKISQSQRFGFSYFLF